MGWDDRRDAEAMERLFSNVFVRVEAVIRRRGAAWRRRAGRDVDAWARALAWVLSRVECFASRSDVSSSRPWIVDTGSEDA